MPLKTDVLLIVALACVVAPLAFVQADVTSFVVEEGDPGLQLPAAALPTFDNTQSFTPDAGAVLPQNEAWQYVLREEMQTLTASDFENTLSEMSYNDTMPSDNEERLAWFMTIGDDPRGRIPQHIGLRHDSDAFVLSNIEDTPDIKMDMRDVRPTGMAFWTMWDMDGDTGNPHYNKTSNKNRCWVAAAVDMMMYQDGMADGSVPTRADYLGTSMLRHVTCYLAATQEPNPVLDEQSETAAAYRFALKQQAQKLQSDTMGCCPGQTNQHIAAPLSIYIAGMIRQEQSLKNQAETYFKDEVLNTGWYTGVPYAHHDGGLDAQYHGWSNYLLSWIVDVTNKDGTTNFGGLADTFPKILGWRSQMIFTEWERPRFDATGPSDFNAANPTSVLDEEDNRWQAITHGRYDTGIHDLELDVGGRANANPHDVPQDTAGVNTRIQTGVNQFNGFRNLTRITDPPTNWIENHDRPLFAWPAIHTFYDATVWAHLEEERTASSKWLTYPNERADTFIKQWGKQFITWKLNNTAGMIFTGAIATSRSKPGAGFSGGNLSIFQSRVPDTPMVGIQGITRGDQSDVKDVWSNWQSWAVHTVSGTNGGERFSASQLHHKKPSDSSVDSLTYDVTEDTFQVDIAGKVGPTNSRTMESPTTLSSDINYSRTFQGDSTGLVIITSVGDTSAASPDEIWEMIPMNKADSTATNAGTDGEVQYFNGSTWQILPTSLTTGVEKLRMSRDNGIAVVIDMKDPASVSVKRSPEDWSGPNTGDHPNNRDNDLVRNAMIDVSSDTTINYKMIPQ